MSLNEQIQYDDDDVPAYTRQAFDFDRFGIDEVRRARLAAPPAMPAGADVSAELAALCVVGLPADAARIVRLLHHPSPDTAAAVEQVLWSIWLRAGSPAANRALADALDLLSAAPYDALAAIRALCVEEPSFAEAHHQRGLLACELELHDEAAAAFETAHALNPFHFGALTGLGTVCACRGDFAAAARAFRRSLAINPRQELVLQFLSLAPFAPTQISP